jgi:hypothetical protein
MDQRRSRSWDDGNQYQGTAEGCTNQGPFGTFLITHSGGFGRSFEVSESSGLLESSIGSETELAGATEVVGSNEIPPGSVGFESQAVSESVVISPSAPLAISTASIPQPLFRLSTTPASLSIGDQFPDIGGAGGQMAGGAGGLSDGAISGIVVGVLVLAAGSAVAVWLLLHQKNVNSPATLAETEMQATDAPSWLKGPMSDDGWNSSAISRPQEPTLEEE